MSDTQFDSLLRRWARGLVSQLGEVVHVSAIYLGIAVLVALMAVLVLPSVQDQARQAYVATLYALHPDGDQRSAPGASTVPAEEEEGLRPGTVPGSEPPGMEQLFAERRHSGPGARLEALQRQFDQMLLDNPDRLPLADISPAQFQALRSYLTRKYRIAQNVAGALIYVVFKEGREREMDPQLLLAVIAIESRYNPFAESHVGAQGLMQVMTRVHRDKFEALGRGPAAALDPIPNVMVGMQILSDCINRRGSVQRGLACYVGATGPSDGGYGAKVLAERRRIALASGIAVAPG